MTEKSKRKGNPRRRLLVASLLIIGLIIALVSAGVYVLRPGGAQIVFVAPDDEGIDQLWIANLNTPENPRQLTTLASPPFLTGFIIAPDSERMILHLYDGMQHALWHLNLQTGTTQEIRQCDLFPSCTAVLFSPDGRWLAGEDRQSISISRAEVTLRIDDLETGTQQTIFSVEVDISRDLPDILITWIEESGYLIYRSNPVNDPSEITIYDVRNNRVVDTGEIIESGERFNLRFSPDGQYYASRIFQMETGLQINQIYAINDSGTILSSTTATQQERAQQFLMLQDWHPDSEHILVTRGQRSNDILQFNNLSVFNSVDGTVEVLLNNDGRYTYASATFNYDGSRILYSRSDKQDHHNQIMLYDMETGEEIELPLSGAFPQWVNGGR